MSVPQRILVYLLRRDLRVADNPVFHEIANLNKQSQRPFTHLLPIYVFPADQVEVSGFLAPDVQRSPYQEARSQVGGFWRCGRLRAKFLAECVWDVKKDLESIGSGLEVRAGALQDVVHSVLEGYRDREDAEVCGVWMTSEEGWEEKYQEDEVRALLEKEDKEFKLCNDEKYYIDDRDLPFQDSRELSDVFTSFRKTVEPLRDQPRKLCPKPEAGELPALPSHIPPQAAPFEISDNLQGLISALWKPIHEDLQVPNVPTMPSNVTTAHPFTGGSSTGLERIRHLISSGAMSSYKDTRNGLLGEDFSTKLSAWLALGSITSKQVHWMLVDFEDGKTQLGADVEGYGRGENKGTAAVRFELLWRDYMRLCTKKFDKRLFHLGGFRRDTDAKFKLISSPYTKSTEKQYMGTAKDPTSKSVIERFLAGRTGTGLIDASQRELFLTGYTSNRARQNVASYLAKHLGVDWRIGAEWYETNLIDYDVSSNWGNWQYVSGVGNDPRGQARVFNPVKQAVDYDMNGEYVRAWVPELRDVGRGGSQIVGSNDSMEDLMGVFQAWRMPSEEKNRLGLQGVDWVEEPLVRIDFSVNRRGGGSRRGRGGGGGDGGRATGRGRGRGGRGRVDRGRGRAARTGQMEKAGWIT